MSAAVRPMSRAVELQTGVGVHELLQSSAAGNCRPTRAARTGFSTPWRRRSGPQALSLLGPTGARSGTWLEVRMAPAGAAMMTFDEPIDVGAGRVVTGPAR